MNTFWEKGYHATSLTDLVTTTGLNKNTLYTEFGSKSGLFHHALELYTSMGVQQAVTYLENKPMGLENIRRYFRSMSYEPECRGCLMTMTINQKNLVPPKSIDIVRRALTRIEQLLYDNLFAGYKAGKFRELEDCQRLATFLIFSIQGITTMGKLAGNQRKLDQVVETILTVLDC